MGARVTKIIIMYGCGTCTVDKLGTVLIVIAGAVLLYIVSTVF